MEKCHLNHNKGNVLKKLPENRNYPKEFKITFKRMSSKREEGSKILLEESWAI